MTNSPTKPTEERTVEFMPLGCTEKIKLSVKIVQNLIAVPTRSGRTCSERDALKFIMLCTARKLNPFEGDAFLIGYDGQNGPEFSLITAHQALIKRAEVHPEFDGMSSGVIVRDGENGAATMDLEGDFHLEDQPLVGAWAKVFFKTRKYPSTDRIALRNFIKTTAKGEPTKFWKENPAGQLVKCAEASALRKAFPTMCGGMYLREEVSLLGESLGVIPQPDLTGGPSTPNHQPSTTEDNSNPDLAPGESTAKNAKNAERGTGARDATGTSPQSMLEALAQENGLTFDAYQRWAQETGNDAEAGSRADWSEIPADMASRYLRAQAGFIKSLRTATKGASQ